MAVIRSLGAVLADGPPEFAHVDYARPAPLIRPNRFLHSYQASGKVLQSTRKDGLFTRMRIESAQIDKGYGQAAVGFQYASKMCGDLGETVGGYGPARRAFPIEGGIDLALCGNRLVNGFAGFQAGMRFANCIQYLAGG